MTRIVWGASPRTVEVGVDHGVLYLPTGAVPWNGLVSVEEEFETTVQADFYYDGIRNVIGQARNRFSAKIESYTYPVQLESYVSRVPVDLSYREGNSIHLVYNAILRPTPVGRKTISSNVEPALFKWDVSARTQSILNARPSSHMVLDLSNATEEAISYVEELLYGSDEVEPFLPPLADIVELVLEHTVLRIFDHGDGTWTATGPDHMVMMLDETSFEITSPSATYLDEDTYVLSDYMP